jgi:hypothetical protein
MIRKSRFSFMGNTRTAGGGIIFGQLALRAQSDRKGGGMAYPITSEDNMRRDSHLTCAYCGTKSRVRWVLCLSCFMELPEQLRRRMIVTDGGASDEALDYLSRHPPPPPEERERLNAEAAARLLCLALCDCGEWFKPVPLAAHRKDCKYRVRVEEGLKEPRQEGGRP